jgi:HNH endonuclease
MNYNNKLTIEELKEELLYEETTGNFYWLKEKQGRNQEKPAGHINNFGYTSIVINGNKYLGHRLVFLYMTGSWPLDYVDHIDGNPRNNKWSNLREATAAENSYNKKRKYDSYTGIKGVVKDFRSETWHVHMKIDGNVVSKGPFYSYQAACSEYDNLAEEARGEFHRKETPRVQQVSFSNKTVTQVVEDFIKDKQLINGRYV